jgi:hypothetical protein
MLFYTSDEEIIDTVATRVIEITADKMHDRVLV